MRQTRSMMRPSRRRAPPAIKKTKQIKNCKIFLFAKEIYHHPFKRISEISYFLKCTFSMDPYICLLRWEFIKENKKVWKQEGKKTRTRLRKWSRKKESFSCSLSWSSSCLLIFLDRVLVFFFFLIAFLVEFLFSFFSWSLSWSRSCFLTFLFFL